MSDELLNHEWIQEYNKDKNQTLIEFNFKCLTIFLGLIFLILLVSPFGANAKELVLEKGKKVIENEDFFFDGQRKIQKLYQEYDYRPTKKSNKICKKIIDTTIVKTVSTSNNNLEVILNFPPIDIVKIFNHLFTTERPLVVTTTQLVPLVDGLKDKMLLIRGGFLGYAAGKLGEKVASKVLGRAGKKVSNWLDSDNDSSDGKSTKQKNQLLSSVLQFFKDNPTVVLILAGYAIVNRKQNGNIVKDTIHNTLPSNVDTILVGKKHSPKTIFLALISPRKLYLYLTLVVLILLLYRVQFYKLFRREMTPSEVISEITKSFLKTNSELFNKFYDLPRDFTQKTVKTENLSFEAGQQASKEKFDLFEKNLNECKSKKFTINKELRSKNDIINNCPNTYNILNTHTESFLNELSREESFKALEFEIKSKMSDKDIDFIYIFCVFNYLFQ